MDKIAGPMAAAFRGTYWWSVVLLALAFLPALLLPRHTPDVEPSVPPADTPADAPPAETPTPAH
jgi:hypothetical protein